MIQFCTRERSRIFQSLNTPPISSYRTFARGGYIMSMSPAAMGMFVVPTWKKSTTFLTPGKSQPAATPANIAAKIQRVR